MHLLALTLKDIRLLLRDRAGLFFALGFPLVYAVMFGLIFGSRGGGEQGPELTVVVVDDDRTDESRQFVETLVSAGELVVEPVETVEEAMRLVRTGQRVAYVRLTEGFGDAGQRLFWGDPARLEVGVDPSHLAEAGMLHGILAKYAYRRFQDVFTQGATLQQQAVAARLALSRVPAGTDEVRRSLDALLASAATLGGAMDRDGNESDGGDRGGRGWQPVEVTTKQVAADDRRGPLTAFAVSFPQAIVWGLMGCASAFGTSLVVERSRGTLVRLRTAPFPRWHILLGKSGACFVATVAVASTLLGLSTLLGVRLGGGEIARLVLAVIAVAWAFVGLMMLVAVAGGHSERASGSMAWAVLVVMAIIGGGAVPLFLMPQWLQSLATISPVKWAILALEGAIWRGYSWGEMVLPCAVLAGVGLVGMAGGALAFRWSERTA
ncbi:MAG: ABC transporter permease [Planctomycetota bacterium]|jgi:ABC-2 type transport system permease protein